MKSSNLTIRLDQELARELDRACARTGRTRSDFTREALREYIQRRKQMQIVDLFGKLELTSSHDNKKQRRRP